MTASPGHIYSVPLGKTDYNVQTLAVGYNNRKNLSSMYGRGRFDIHPLICQDIGNCIRSHHIFYTLGENRLYTTLIN